MALRDVDGSIGATPIGGGSGGGGDLLRLLELRPEWWADAACTDYPLEWWFPERGETSDRAKSICRRCLVVDECRAFADSDPLAKLHGIWAGESAVQRRRARQAKRRQAA